MKAIRSNSTCRNKYISINLSRFEKVIKDEYKLLKKANYLPSDIVAKNEAAYYFIFRNFEKILENYGLLRRYKYYCELFNNLLFSTKGASFVNIHTKLLNSNKGYCTFYNLMRDMFPLIKNQLNIDILDHTLETLRYILDYSGKVKNIYYSTSINTRNIFIREQYLLSSMLKLYPSIVYTYINRQADLLVNYKEYLYPDVDVEEIFLAFSNAIAFMIVPVINKDRKIEYKLVLNNGYCKYEEIRGVELSDIFPYTSPNVDSFLKEELKYYFRENEFSSVYDYLRKENLSLYSINDYEY